MFLALEVQNTAGKVKFLSDLILDFNLQGAPAGGLEKQCNNRLTKTMPRGKL